MRVPSYAVTLDKKQLRSTLRKAGAEIANVARSKGLEGWALGGLIVVEVLAAVLVAALALFLYDEPVRAFIGRRLRRGPT